MKNGEVAEAFVRGEQSRGLHIYTTNNVIYSYGDHFPIAIRLSEGYYIFNTDRYSSTTSCHKGVVRRAILSVNGKIIEVDTKIIRDLVAMGVCSLSEMVMNKLKGR